MMELYEGGWLDVINAVDLALQSQAANAVRKYPYGPHDRFDSEEKRCFFEILMTFIDYARPERMKKN
jgi:hypothetical protein